MSEFNNPHQVPPLALGALVKSVKSNRQLIYQMVKREVVGRYRGSMLGLAWSFFNPVLMLIIYTFVFSVIFKSRWGSGEAGDRAEFALILFVGMIIFSFFSEVITRAPGLVLGNVNYVKKVVFPLEILPIISLGAAFFHALISFIVLLLGYLAVHGFINWTAVFLPMVLLPLVFLMLGISWFLASLGVFSRDVGQTIGILVSLLMFLSPVFYPLSAIPKNYQVLIMLNPLSYIIEQARAVLIFGQMPDWTGLGIYFLISIIIMKIGFSWFQKTRKGFSDVL